MTSSIFDASVLLPGLKLKASEGVEVPEDVKSLTKDGSMLVFLKKFDGDLIMFRDQIMFLEATYESRETTSDSGANETVEEAVAEDFVVEEPDEEDPWEPDPEPWDNEKEEKFVEVPYKDILADEWEWAKKRVNSPTIDGYDSFLLKPNDIWKSSEKTIEEIELCFFFTETDVMPSDSLNESENKGVEIGEAFVIDRTDANNPVSNNIVILEWDLSCILMKEVSSPRERQVLKQEIEISDEILLLGMHGGQSFDPSQSLVVHAHLHDYLDGSYSNLRLKVYDNCEIEPSPKISFDDMVDNCIQQSCTCDAVGTFSANDKPENENYIEFEIDPSSLLQMLKKSAAASENSFVLKLLEEYEAKGEPLQTMIDAIEGAKFAAVIEDRGSGNKVAKFLLSSIISNDIYFDSAAQMIKSPDNRSYETITDWSKMVTRTAQSGWDSLYTHADYKLTRYDSTPLEPDDKVSQEFSVKFALPNINTDVATVDIENDITILVENCDSNLSFVSPNENMEFLYLRDPVKLDDMINGDKLVEFKWNCIDKGDEERSSEMKVSFLIELKDRRPMKIGRTVSIVRDVGGASKQHKAMVRLRNMVKMGFEAATEIQCSFAHFVETTFKMVYAFSTGDQLSISSSLFLEKAADDIATQFYKVVADSKSDIYSSIAKSPLFERRDLCNPENIKVIGESEVAEFVHEIFGSFGNFGLRDWADTMKLDEDSLKLAEQKGDMSIDVLVATYVENLGGVIRMNSTDLASQLQKHPELMQDFVDAAQLVRDEVDGPPPDEQCSAEGLDLPETDLSQVFNESGAKEITYQAQEILAGMEEKIQSTVFSDEQNENPQLLMENVSAMETTLLQMLENTAEHCDDAISFIEMSQGSLLVISELLTKLRYFGTNIKTLSNNATSLINFVEKFWKAFQLLSNFSIGPLAAIKTIVSAIKTPMKIILKALKNGQSKIRTLSRTVDNKLKKIVTRKMINKVDHLSENVGKPVPGLQKVAEIVDMLISVASLGILPMDLISKFASSTSLASFFATLSGSIETVKTTLSSVYTQTQQIQPEITKMRTFSNNVAAKFAFISPLDRGLKLFQPYIDKIQALFNRFTGWWRRLLAGAMWPIEQAINALLYPFRSQINKMIAQLNPFRAIDAIMAPVISPLSRIPSDALDGRLDTMMNLTSIHEMSKLDGFKGMQDSITLGVAAIQRGLYTLLEGLLIQGSNNVDFLEQLLAGSAEFSVVKNLLGQMQLVNPEATLGDAILEMKKSIDGSIASCDSYLTMYASNAGHTYKDGFTEGQLGLYVGSSDYDLTHCAINTSHDESSALFEYGRTGDSPKNAWMMSAIAVLLHHGTITEQAAQIGIFSPDKSIKTSFMPDDKGSGRFTVSLYPKMSTMQVFDVDSRLPITKTTLSLGSVEEFPIDIFNYANARITAQVDPIFSERKSLALVEKVVGCKLGMTTTESVGTAMHLLSGNRSGYCYKRGSSGNEWNKFVGNGPARETEKYDTLAMQSTADGNVSEQDLIELMKNRTMSKNQVELLDYFHSMSEEEREVKAADLASLEDAMNDFSMFVVVTSPTTMSLKTLNTSSTYEVAGAKYSVDFSNPGVDLASFNLVGGAQIQDNAPGGIQALRIDSSAKRAVLPVNINSTVMPRCTIVIGVYLESEANDRGWVLSIDKGGYNRSIVLHDDRFKGMGMPSGGNRSVWSNDDEGQPRMKQWMHIAAVYSQGASNNKFYVDGVLAPNQIYSSTGWGYSQVTIGTNPGFDNHWVDCWVKEVKIYDRILSDDEIQQLNNQFQMELEPPEYTPSAGIAHPVLYTDNTTDSNIVYADGSSIKPLNWSEVSEVWEFPIAGSSSGQSINAAFVERKIALEEVSSEVTTVAPAIVSTKIDLGITPEFRGDDHLTLQVAGVEDDEPILKKAISKIDVMSTPWVYNRHVEVFRQCVRQMMSRITINERFNKRKISKGDHVKWKNIQNVFQQGCVDEVIPEDKRRDTPKKYKIVKYVVKLPTEKLVVERATAKKLDDEEKQQYDILRYDNIFFGKGLQPTALEQHGNARKRLQTDITKAKQWGITFTDLEKYVNHCKYKSPYLWSKCKHKRGKPAGNKFVSILDLVEHFIKPQTKGTGSSIALNMIKPETAQNAQVFVSLSWDEDIEQVMVMLKSQIDTTRIGKTPTDLFRSNSVLWLSPFSLYQGGDNAGPTLESQLANDVFKKVIHKASTSPVRSMFVIRTGICNAYTRLWCVSELLAAIENDDLEKTLRNDIRITHIFSRDWKEKYIQNETKDFEFRWDNGVYRKMITKATEHKVRVGNPDFLRSANYYLMDEQEYTSRYGVIQPVLRANVQAGLRSRVGPSQPTRPADTREFEKLDAYSRNYELWWKLQTIIVEKERAAAGAAVDRKSKSEQSHTMSYEFVSMHALRVGTNTDIVRRFQNDNGTIKSEAKKHLAEEFLPKLTGLDSKGRRFLEFKEDDHAALYFKHAMELTPGYNPAPENFQHLLSFGANNVLLGPDVANFSFPNIERLARNLGGTYVDSMRLPALASSYKLVPDEAGVAHPRNIYWAEYYQKVMEIVPKMTFVITAAWVGSKNCWEELDWAATHRNKEKNPGLTTILVFSDMEHWKKLKDTTAGFKWGTTTKIFSWNELTAKIGFYNEENTVLVAKNVSEVQEKIENFKAPIKPEPTRTPI